MHQREGAVVELHDDALEHLHGRLYLQQAQKQDYPTLLGITVLVALATVIGSLLADIAYAVLDPRVRYVKS